MNPQKDRASDQAMQNGARAVISALRPDGSQSLFQVLAGGDELRQFALGFEFDFQFCNVKVFRVPKLTQEDGVHQLGNSLRDFPCVGLLRHFKEDDLGWRLGVYEVEQVAGPSIAQLLLKKISEFVAENLPVFQCVAEVLGERTFARPEEARHPHAHAFVRIAGGLSDGFEEILVLLADTIGGDVFLTSA